MIDSYVCKATHNVCIRLLQANSKSMLPIGMKRISILDHRDCMIVQVLVLISGQLPHWTTRYLAVVLVGKS